MPRAVGRQPLRLVVYYDEDEIRRTFGPSARDVRDVTMVADPIERPDQELIVVDDPRRTFLPKVP